jgi:hypothetical protein
LLTQRYRRSRRGRRSWLHPASNTSLHLPFLGGFFTWLIQKHLFFVLAIVVGSAVVLEFAQLLTPDRHGTVIDALQKLAGGGLGVLVTSTLFRLRVREQ